MFKYFADKLKKIFLAIIYPKTCADCGLEGVILCEKCLSSLKLHTPQCFVCHRRNSKGKICKSCKQNTAYSLSYSLLSYKDAPVNKMIHLLKYRGIKEYGVLFGKLLSSAALKHKLAPKNSVMVAMPLHQKRERLRGFNQAQIIAKTCAEIIKIPLLDSKILVRTRDTIPQAQTLNKSARLQNVQDAFAVRDATEIFNKTVILIDDVITTGATTNEASKALKQGGAKNVYVLTVAK